MSNSFEELNDLVFRLELQKKVTKTLMDLWQDLFPSDYLPFPKQFIIWLDRYPLDVVEKGIRRAAAKFQEMGGDIDNPQHGSPPMTKEDCTRYASGVMKWTVYEQ